MALTEDIKKDIKAAQKMRLSWQGVLCVIVGSLPIIYLLDHAGRIDLAVPILNSIGVVGLVVLLKWNLRGHLWFWIAVFIIAALHIPLVLAFPWTTKWVPAIFIAVIDSLDFFAMLVIFSVIRRVVTPDSSCR